MGHPAESLFSGLFYVGSTQFQEQAVWSQTFCAVSYAYSTAFLIFKFVIDGQFEILAIFRSPYPMLPACITFSDREK